MIEKFDIPVTNANVDASNSKEIKINSYLGNLVRAPYDGIVDMVDINQCGGYIKIKHNINGIECYSSFCEVNRITVNKSDRVEKGKSIGIVGDNDITYSILDSRGKKINTKPFFSGIDTSSNKNDTDVKNKEEKNKDVNLPSINKNDDIWTNIGLAPFFFVDKLLANKFKTNSSYRESVMKDESIQEDIKRIKRLL